MHTTVILLLLSVSSLAAMNKPGDTTKLIPHSTTQYHTHDPYEDEEWNNENCLLTPLLSIFTYCLCCQCDDHLNDAHDES